MMQSKMTTMASWVLSCTVCAISALAAESHTRQQNMLLNPGFELLTPDNWPRHWGGSREVFSVERGGRTGKYSLKCENKDPKRYELCVADIPGIKPGMRLAFSGWIRGQNLTKRATICVEWFDRNSKWIHGSYPTTGVQGTSPDWIHISGITYPLPKNAASARIVCLICQGGVGRAWFDDLSVRVYHPPIAEKFATNAYRETVAGGHVIARTFLNLQDYQITKKDVSATLELHDGSGALVDRMSNPRIEDDFCEFRIDADPLPVGEYRAELTVLDNRGGRKATCTGKLTRVEKLPRRTVMFDENQRTLVNGKPFFPLGMYFSTVTPDQVALYAKSPFNCLISYHPPTKEMMDLMWENHLRLIYSFGIPPATPEAEGVSVMKRAIRTYKGHPALLAWYTYDEASTYDLDKLIGYKRMVEKLDPDHPVWAVVCQIQEVREYQGSYDVFGTDPYPIPDHPPAMALEWTKTTKFNTGCGLLPVWQVPQVFSWGGGKRPPTFAEMRSMAWQCIAGGANGLIFFSWYHLRLEKQFTSRWSDVCRMAAEIKESIPILLSLDQPHFPPMAVTSPKSVAWRVWGKGDDTYVLMVNSDTRPAVAELSFADHVGNVTSVFGSLPERKGNKRLVCRLGSLEPVMLRLSSRAPAEHPGKE